MKYTKIIALFIVSMFFFFGAANAQTPVQPVSIDVLKAREALLKETTNLNKLKIKLANLTAEVPKIEAEMNMANEQSIKSAQESKKLADKMSENSGDDKAAKRASSAAKSSYKDARKAQKLTDKLKSTKKKMVDLEADIEKSKAKIAQMDGQLKFTEQSN